MAFRFAATDGALRRPGRNARLVLALVFAALWVPAVAGAGEEGIRVLSQDAGGVSFEVDVAQPEFLPVGTPGEGVFEIGIDGFELTGHPGAPGLPERVVWIGVPLGASLEVSGAGLDPFDLGPVKLAPRVLLADLDRGEPASVDQKARGGYPERLLDYLAAPAYRQAVDETPVAAFARFGGFRSQRVAAIRLHPARYDARTGRLSVVRRIAVTVRFSGGTLAGGRAPVEPAFEPLYRKTLVNYESARSFRRSMSDRLRLAQAERTPRSLRPAASAVNFDAAPRWVQVAVDGKGLQRIGAEDLLALGVQPTGMPPGSIRLFTRRGNPVLNENAHCDTCGLDEVAIDVVGGGDGSFDVGDYILFFGLPASGWLDEYTGPGTTPTRWQDNPYETRNYYWLTWQANLPTAARRWTQRDVSPTLPGAWPAPDYPARAHAEQNSKYDPNLVDPLVPWDMWVWTEIVDQLGPQQFSLDTPGAQTALPARFFTRMWGLSVETSSTRTLPDHVLDVSFNDIPLARRSWGSRLRHDVETTMVAMRETGNRVLLRAPLLADPGNPLRRDRQELLFWEMHFRRRFQAVSDAIDFASPDTTGVVELGLAPFTASGAAGLRLLDVSDPVSPVELTGWTTRDTTGGKAVYLDEDLVAPRFYFGAAPSRFRRPVLANVTIRDPRAAAQGADYLVIAYDDFEPQALRLAALRSQILPGFTSPQAAVVRISDVLAWYSAGRMDPAAIRNFLYDLAHGPDPPSYVCFLGDASYDYKNILRLAQPGRPAALVPSFVHGFFVTQFTTDDWLADVDLGPSDPPPPGFPPLPSDLPDFITGRIPAATANEADVMVDDKIARYDLSPNYGEWRNRVLLVADDFFQGFDSASNPAPDALFGTHQMQSEKADAALPPVIDRQKIYLSKYPFGTGTEKPTANADVKKWVNDGSLLWNFIGHGNPFKMADENAFIISDVPSLTNLDRLTFMIAASCDVGKFDDPAVIGLGEALVKSPLGGCVATFSSSDIAYSSSNSSLNLALFRDLFTETAEGYEQTLGQSCFDIKRRFDATPNDRKYTLQGDPATRLATPHRDVRLALFDDQTGLSLGDSLPRGRRVRVEAEVLTSHDTTLAQLATSFQGKAAVLITDSAPLDTFSIAPGALVQNAYTYNPGGVFHGDVPIENGRGSAVFYVPLEGALGPRAKARVYVQNASDDGVGALTLQLVNGVASEVDTVGPSITLRFSDGGTVVAPDAELRITLEDFHGINLTGHTIPNAITLTIDEKTRYNLTDAFRYDPGSYQRGTLLFRLPGLAPGGHSIVVTAADNFAAGILGRSNRSQAEIGFDVAAGGGVPFARVLNFPNPFHGGRGTQFILSGLSRPSDVEVRVFTVGGTLVRTLKGSGGPGSVQIGWNGYDESGAQAAVGVYPYRVVIRPQGGFLGVEELDGRCAIMP